MLTKKVSQFLSNFNRSGMSFAGIKRVPGEPRQVILVENQVSNHHKILQLPTRSVVQAVVPTKFFPSRKKNPQTFEPEFNQPALKIETATPRNEKSSVENPGNLNSSTGQLLIAENQSSLPYTSINPQIFASTQKKTTSTGVASTRKNALQVLQTLVSNPRKVNIPVTVSNVRLISWVEQKPPAQELSVEDEGAEALEEEVEEVLCELEGKNATVLEMRNKRHEQAKRKRRKRKNGSNNIVRWR